MMSAMYVMEMEVHVEYFQGSDGSMGHGSMGHGSMGRGSMGHGSMARQPCQHQWVFPGRIILSLSIVLCTYVHHSLTLTRFAIVQALISHFMRWGLTSGAD